MMPLSSCIKDELAEPVEVNDVLANVEAQAQAVESSVKHINDLQELIQPYGLDADAMAEKLQTHAKSLSKGISLEEGSSATLKLQGELASLIGSAQAELYRAGALDSDAEKLFASLEKSVRTWLGELFVENYSAAVIQAKVEAIAEELSQEIKKQELSVDALASDVEAGLRKDADPKALAALSESLASRSSDLKSFRAGVASTATQINKEYSAAIRTAVSDPAAIKTAEIKTLNEAAQTQQEEVGTVLSNLAAEIAQCKTKLEELRKKLEILEDSIEGLLELVQSVTFLSEYSEDKAIAYYEMGEEKVSAPGKPYDGKCVRTPVKTVELSYMVRPAAAAAAISKEVVSVVGYYAEQIQTRAVDPSNFINFTVTDAVVTDPELGIITVKLAHDLKDDFYYRETGAKCALFIAAGSSDISSKFVELHPKDNSSTVYVEEIKINSDDFEIDEGQSKTLAATVSPSSATNKTVTWSSSNDEVASINPSTGVLTAVKSGNVKITATTNGIDEWGDHISASVNVRVNAAIRLGGPLYVEVGKTAELSLDFPPAMNIESKVWMSSDETKAKVVNGVVTGIADTYNIYTYEYIPVTITCIVNGNITLNHDMRVVVPQPKQIKFNDYGDDVTSVDMRLGQEISFAATILPTNVNADQFRLFYESDGGLGWIDSRTGAVKAPQTPGTRYVYANVFNVDNHHYFAPGATLRRTVVVNVHPYYVKTMAFAQETMILAPEQTASLAPVFTSDVDGKQPTFKELKWVSSNPDVVSVNETTGEIKTLKEGTATITATTVNAWSIPSGENHKSASCTIVVKKPSVPVYVGDYFYSDGTWSTELNRSKVLRGIVCQAGAASATDKHLPTICTNGYVISVEEITAKLDGDGIVSGDKFHTWAQNHGYYAIEEGDGSWNGAKGTAAHGYSNTLAYVELTEQKAYDELGTGWDGSHYGGWDFYYTGNGLDNFRRNNPVDTEKCSNWYVPSQKEMTIVSDEALTAVNAALSAAGKTQITNKNYKTSSYSTWGNPVVVNPIAKSAGQQSVSTEGPIRFFLAF